MPPSIADVTEPLPLVSSDSGYPTSVMVAPVFFNGSARRHRLVVRGGYLAAAACLAYSVMLGVCVTSLPVTKAGDTRRPASNVTGAGTTATPTTRPAKATPRVAPPVAVPAPRAAADNAAALGAPLMLRLALPATTHPAPPEPPSPAPASRPHHDSDSPHLSKISATPVTSSAAAPSTKTTKRAAH